MTDLTPLHELDVVALRTPYLGRDYVTDAPVTLPANTQGTVVIADAAGQAITVEFQNTAVGGGVWQTVLADLGIADVQRVPRQAPVNAAGTDD